MSAGNDRLRGRYEPVLAQVLAKHGEQLRSTADELLAHGQARVTVGAVTLDAELLTFWRGDPILRIEHATRDRTSVGSSMTRFPRHDRPNGGEVIAHYLASSTAKDLMKE